MGIHSVIGRSNENDLVSMHHKIRLGLKKRLHHYAVDTHQAVTDIVNAACEGHLERLESAGVIVPRTRAREAPETRLRIMKAAAAEGSFYSVANRYSKAELIEVAKHLDMPADARMSGDRIVNMIRTSI